MNEDERTLLVREVAARKGLREALRARVLHEDTMIGYLEQRLEEQACAHCGQDPCVSRQWHGKVLKEQ